MENDITILDDRLNNLFLKLWTANIIEYDAEYNFKLRYSMKENIKRRAWKQIHYSLR